MIVVEDDDTSATRLWDWTGRADRSSVPKVALFRKELSHFGCVFSTTSPPMDARSTAKSTETKMRRPSGTELLATFGLVVALGR